MSDRYRWQRRLVVGVVTVTMLAVAGTWALTRRLDWPPAARPASEPAAVALADDSVEPIAAEALVFSARGALAADTNPGRRRAAHPRTLATYRGLRAYPGAPPRIPHGLTAGEFRATACATCHEHGGYSQRFGAYAPVTPHPELVSCLQCHVADAAVVGVALPEPRPDGLCRQCHAPAATLALPRLARDWRPAAWPRVSRDANDEAPPPIPHDLQLRGNCRACHAGPGVVAEIATTHAQRADCAGCHVLAGDDADVFTRTASPRGAGGRP